jgi:hypothetical protein
LKRNMFPDSLTLTAAGGAFEIDLGPSAEEKIQFFPTHEGLISLATMLELMGSPRVYMDPSILHPHLSGLSSDFDAKGFVEAAYSLSSGGLHTCLGGSA